MSLFAIADLHLSLGSDKPMSVFKGWESHIERLEQNWNAAVSPGDTVVLAGDTSWGTTLETALPDLNFINDKLHGKKIILKGNHDYWWTSLSKMNEFLAANNLDKIDFLYNNAFLVDRIAVCGTRGWLNERLSENDEPHAEKLQKREAGRLEASVKRGSELIENGGELCAFLHYPPIYGGFEDYFLIDILQKYEIKRCFYGHLHGASHKNALSGTRYGIEFTLISADFVEFTPIRVENK